MKNNRIILQNHLMEEHRYSETKAARVVEDMYGDLKSSNDDEQ